jgi:ATP-dependent exoDNAse (exonuclease V) beta subunit
MGQGCPAFGSKDSVLNRPDGDPASRRTVCPGRHDGEWRGDSYSLVWWSPEPGVLDLNKEAPFGLRRDDLIVKTVEPEVMRAYQAAYDSWKDTRQRALTRARTPSLVVMTATEASTVSLPPADGVPVTIETVPADADRPGGVRFGSLVHALLADVPLLETAGDSLSRLASAHGRLLDAGPDEVAAAEQVVSRVLTHPVIRAAARAAADGQCYREAAVTLRAPDGALIEGTVDLAFADESGFVVVDFKTDRELDGAVDRYQRQVQIYAAAIGSATGRPSRAVLMRL